MKKKSFVAVLLVVVLSIVAFLLSACSGKGGEQQTLENPGPQTEQSGGSGGSGSSSSSGGGNSGGPQQNTPSNPQPAQYTVTYHAQGGKFTNGNATLTQTATAGSKLNKPADPKRTGYTFGGWATDTNGATRWEFATDTVTNNTDLYAVWKQEPATLVEVTGATINTKELRVFMVVEDDTTQVSLSDKVTCSDGSKWSLYADDGQTLIPTKIAKPLQDGDNAFYILVTDGTNDNTYELIIHRKYEVEIKYYFGQNVLKTKTIYTSNQFEADYVPNITGYTFHGWKDEQGNAVTSFTVWEERSLYADATANTYTVYLNAAGGEGLDEADKTMTYDSAYEFPTLTRTGYTFLGWYEGETKLTNADGQSIEPWTIDEDDKTIIAKWQVNQYKLTVKSSNSAGGTVTGGGNYDYDSEVTITATAPNLGYTFSGWYKDDERISPDLEYTFTKGLDETYTAQYDIAPEMSNFVFTSTATTCKITGIKDKTVQDIVVPDYVISIGKGAFSGCSNLISITLPFVGDKPHTETDTYQYPFGYIFGTSSYSGGTATKQWYYGSSTSSTTSATYYIPTSLKTVTITGSSYIPAYAFSNCSNLTEITIPSSITSIGEDAFYNCSSITEITIPASVTSISESAFYGCTNLNTVNWNATNCTEAGDYNDYIFYNCTSLTTVNIGENVETIPAYAFYNCSKITEITIPASVTSIECAFLDCTNLQTVTFAGNSTLKSIGSSAFSGCSKLTELTIPASVTSIGARAFLDCTNLETVTFAGDSRLESIGGSAFYGWSGLTSITIPASVTSIGYEAFYGCTNLQTVMFAGDSRLQSIGERAFYGCGNLTSITIPENVTSIGSWAFDDCTNLQTVTFAGDSKLESIGSVAFWNCSSLTSITIPASVTSIGISAFCRCTNLQTAVFDNPDNWKVSEHSDMRYPRTLSSENLRNPTTAAQYLRDTYDQYYWKRS